jgi:hypothetical protein
MTSCNAPQQVSMNGNDIYGIARMVVTDNAVVMLRPQNERHYFPAANIIGANLIQLNCPSGIQTGDRVIFFADPSVGSALTGGNGPVSGTYCYVNNQGNNQIKLYSDSAMTVGYTFTGGLGRFYIERAAVNPGFGGNGAPPLIAIGNAAGNTWNQVGFKSVPVQIFATAYNGTTKYLTVANHKLKPGDSVNYFKQTMGGAVQPMSGTTENGGSSSPWFAYPVNTNNVILYTTQLDALQNSGANLASVSYGGVNDYIVKTMASAQPMPPARLGFYTATQQLVLVNGANNIFVSDPNDPLHYEPLVSQFTANLGDADEVTAVSAISGNDSLLFLKNRSVYVLYNFSQGPNAWALVRITRDYGCVATESVSQMGSSLCFLSRRGYDRVISTAFGVIEPVEKPISWDMKKYTDLIDWNNASLASAYAWNNRVLIALPLKNQAMPSTQNNAVLSLNLLNSNPAEDKFGWEGMWSGGALSVFKFAIHTVYGEDRLTFCDFSGNVSWLSGGWVDETPSGAATVAPVVSVVTTRALFKGQSVQVIKGEVNWDTFNPNISVQLKMAGVNEIETLGTFAYQNNSYQIANATPYDPSNPTPTGWAAPYRADYSMGVNELLVGQLDTFQNTTEPLRSRTRGRNPQLVITNSQGAMKLVKAELAAKLIDVRGTMT